jgi:hypothetical protein
VDWLGALRGLSPVFGTFLEYVRGMQFDEEPDYERWRDRFRSLVSDGKEPLLYDPSGAQLPLVGSIMGCGGPFNALRSPSISSGRRLVTGQRRLVSHLILASARESQSRGSVR